MTNVIVKSLTDGKRVSDLLDKDVPTYRQAYSDRTAWIMACLSELVYIKFNVDKNPKFVLDLDMMKKVADDNRLDLLQKLVTSIKYDNESERKNLEKELGGLKMELIKTFDDNGTQAILISCEKFIVLVFRGTELESIQDIKTDIKVKKTLCETGGGIHSGFKEAFDRVAIDIQDEINDSKFKDKPLFVTGHSLGGALATIAVKKLKHEEGGIAACYTFGSPRVGDEDWIADIKTPIYRLVNSADCVTMLPPKGGKIRLVLWPFRRILLTFLIIVDPPGVISRQLTPTFGRYIHAGNMRYMTNCKSGQYKDVELLYSVSFFRQLIGRGKMKWPLTKFIVDHSISIYRKKLMVIAERRNQIT